MSLAFTFSHLFLFVFVCLNQPIKKEDVGGKNQMMVPTVVAHIFKKMDRRKKKKEMSREVTLAYVFCLSNFIYYFVHYFFKMLHK
jgi:hypothetical protein